MKFRCLLLFTTLWTLNLIHSNSAEALNWQVERILNPKNRQLPKPSRSITSRNYAFESRQKLETQRQGSLLEKDSERSLHHPREEEAPTLHKAEENKAPLLPSEDISESSVPHYDDVENPILAPQNPAPSPPRYQSIYKKKKRSLKKTTHKEALFSLGLTGGGSLGLIGLEADIAFKKWNFGAGIGTGYDYSSISTRARYYSSLEILKMTPFVELGYAYWDLKTKPKDGQAGFPHYLTERFFSKDGRIVNEKAHILYPGAGILFYGAPEGLAVTAQAQYLIHVRDLQGGLTASVGLVKFF